MGSNAILTFRSAEIYIIDGNTSKSKSNTPIYVPINDL